MEERYELKIFYSNKAKKSFKKLSKSDKKRLVDTITTKTEDFIYNNDKRYVYQEHPISYMNKMYKSTLYCMRLWGTEIAILTIDKDPIFEQVLITVFAICSRDNVRSVLPGISQSLYQKIINGTEEW